MKNVIMKEIIALGLIFLVYIFALTIMQSHVKPILPNTELIDKANERADSLQTANDSLQKVSEQNLYKANLSKRSENNLRKVVITQSVAMDTLKQFYIKNHTLRVCDSVVNVQSIHIDSLMELNKITYARAEYYSIALDSEKKQNVNNIAILADKNKIINEYKNVIDKSNCINSWTDKHRFWKWLLGINCN